MIVNEEGGVFLICDIFLEFLLFKIFEERKFIMFFIFIYYKWLFGVVCISGDFVWICGLDYVIFYKVDKKGIILIRIFININLIIILRFMFLINEVILLDFCICIMMIYFWGFFVV